MGRQARRGPLGLRVQQVLQVRLALQVLTVLTVLMVRQRQLLSAPPHLLRTRVRHLLRTAARLLLLSLTSF